MIRRLGIAWRSLCITCSRIKCDFTGGHDMLPFGISHCRVFWVCQKCPHSEWRDGKMKDGKTERPWDS